MSLAILVFLLTVGLVLRRPLTLPQRTAVIWFGAAATFYFFLMLKVHTHYYVVLPGWLLLVAPLVAGADEWLRARTRAGLWAARLLAGLWAVACLGYLTVAFVRHNPEYRVAYPASKPAWYVLPYGGMAPRGGYFGFPYATAWKAVGALYADGVLKGAYDSNQEDLVTNWYTRGALRLPGADTFIVAATWRPPQHHSRGHRWQLPAGDRDSPRWRRADLDLPAGLPGRPGDLRLRAATGGRL